MWCPGAVAWPWLGPRLCLRVDVEAETHEALCCDERRELPAEIGSYSDPGVARCLGWCEETADTCKRMRAIRGVLRMP